MTLKYSTGLRNAMATAFAVAASGPVVDGCVLSIYAGAEPAAADDALGSATLLATYSTGGVGDPLAWEAPANGSISKVAADTWQATAVASGTPTFFRYQLPDDDGSLSTTAVRMQGKVGLVSDMSADLALSTLAISNGAPLTIDAASATVPASL